GNGFALTLAAEMPSAGGVDEAYTADYIAADLDDDIYVLNDRRELPAFVAALDASGGWGEAHLAGVVLRNEARQWVVSDPVGDPDFAEPAGADSDIGWGVNFGLVLNVPTGEGDNF